MSLVSLFETAGGDSVGEDKKCSMIAQLLVESLEQKVILSVQHSLETHSTHIAIRRTINCIAECHVVGGHGFGDCSGCSAYLKESARHLLAGTDFGERAVFFGVEVDLERLLVRPYVHFWIHSKFNMWPFDGFSTGSQATRLTRGTSGFALT